ncbi:MAG: hypothetical protein GY795_10575 [Desulfobacterales bacterium]|nr:hypothetical protein [Desulfobacterales bacterium]
MINEYQAFSEKISPFLRKKIADAQESHNDCTLRVLHTQYVRSPEENVRLTSTLKHYEASEKISLEGRKILGVERLYGRVIVFELIMQCAAHCRYCLRQNYQSFKQREEDIFLAAKFIGGCHALHEILVTGGDPFLLPGRLKIFLDAVAEFASHIEIIRIATRLPLQQPNLINDRLLDVLGEQYPFRLEVATQINHAAELFPEVIKAFQQILNTVSVVYNQTVLLKGVNDTQKELIELCNQIRSLGIENHYLFHCVPIVGLNHLRTPLLKSIELANALTSCGSISGRAKPKFCVMTKIGKIVPYEGCILEQKEHKFLLKSHYLYEERKSWNPHWKQSSDIEISDDGFLCVWYEDVID